MGGQVVRAWTESRDRQEWLDFLRDVVLEQDGYSCVSSPELRAVGEALTVADIALTVAKEKIGLDDPQARHWVRSAIEELVYYAEELGDGYVDQSSQVTPSRNVADATTGGDVSRNACRSSRSEHKCTACGTTFVPPRSDARYCSPACRQRAYRARRAS